jgi:O-antigen/teichoic acid export membrane protein
MEGWLYVILRAGNSAATVLAGFLTTYVLVRRLGVDGYSNYVVTTAVGIYLSATDAGISRTVYAKLRQAFLAGNTASEAVRIRGAVILYGMITLSAVTIFGIVQSIVAPAGGATSQCLYFIYVALNLSWMLLRYVAWAIDRHLSFDSIDLTRRTVQIAVLLVALLHVDLRIVFLLLDVVWVISFAAGSLVIRRRLHDAMRIDHPRLAIAEFWAGYSSLLRSSAVFSLIEFAIYNFPFFLIPEIYGKGAPLVAFDLFYKLFRAGVTGNQIASTSMLPRQTRAFHDGDEARLRYWTLTALLLSLAAVSPLALGLVGFGERGIHLLLSGANVMGAAGITAVVIAIYSNSFQNVAGSLLMHVGLIREGVLISYTILAVMILLSAAAALGLLGLEHFILAYAIAYALGSASWTLMTSRVISRHFNKVPGTTHGVAA